MAWQWCSRLRISYLAGSVILSINNELCFEDAIKGSEMHFERELPKKDLFLSYLEKSSIKSVSDIGDNL